ncbi:MAG: hypothetical protein LBS56_04660 [Propionibacteriaceae bacterium]|jgi:phenylacetate-coenzyme A ligase PaaK-like adenylate-forming protein|nr:hypothetical protein [Propionibacteriaceae bacterium]
MSYWGAAAAAWRYDRWDFGRRAGHREQKLAKLLEHARASSRFYGELWRDVPVGAALELFPSVTKNQLMDRFDDWVADPDVTFEDVRRFYDTQDNVGHLFRGRYLVCRSSGTSGVQLALLHGPDTRQVNDALRLVRGFPDAATRWRCYRRGGRIAAVYADARHHIGNGTTRLAMNNERTAKYVHLVDAYAPVESTLDGLNQFQPAQLYGYASGIDRLAEQQLAGRLAIDPVQIVSNGEAVHDVGRERIERAWPKAHVGNEYTATEVGVIAVSCAAGFSHVHDDWFIVEPVDAAGQSVDEGELAQGWLLTNLANFDQPLVRYEMTDQIRRWADGCPCGRRGSYVKLEGRAFDRGTMEGSSGPVEILPVALIAAMVDIPGPPFDRYQLRLGPGNHVEVRLDAADRERAFAAVKETVQELLGRSGVEVRVELAPGGVVPDPTTGKTPQVTWVDRSV